MTETIEKPPETNGPPSQQKVNKESTAIATRPEPGGIVIRQMSELWHFAQLYEASGMAPKGMKAEAIAISIQTGMELGLSPAQSVQSIAVINGRPQIYGAAAQALVESSGLMADFDFYFDEGGKRTDHPTKFDDTTAAVCVTLRRGRKRAYTTRFTVADAKRAGLWDKAGPWKAYPARMMHWRAIGHNLADNFGDVLKGLESGTPAPSEINVITAEPDKGEVEDRPGDLAELQARTRVKAARTALGDAGLWNDELNAELQKATAFSKMTTAELNAAAEIMLARLAAGKQEAPENPPGKGDAYEGDQEPETGAA